MNTKDIFNKTVFVLYSTYIKMTNLKGFCIYSDSSDEGAENINVVRQAKEMIYDC